MHCYSFIVNGQRVGKFMFLNQPLPMSPNTKSWLFQFEYLATPLIFIEKRAELYSIIKNSDEKLIFDWKRTTLYCLRYFFKKFYENILNVAALQKLHSPLMLSCVFFWTVSSNKYENDFFVKSSFSCICTDFLIS